MSAAPTTGDGAGAGTVAPATSGPAAVAAAAQARALALAKYRSIYEAMDAYDFRTAYRLCERKEIATTPLGKVGCLWGASDTPRTRVEVADLAPKSARGRCLRALDCPYMRPCIYPSSFISSYPA